MLSQRAATQEKLVSYTRQDSLRVVELLRLGQEAATDGRLKDIGSMTLFFARQFIGRPYVTRTLEIKDKKEHLAVNLHSLDCTTLVENVCALALTISRGGRTWNDFLYWLRMLRYQDGHINGYSSRNHYFSGWIRSGERLGVLREIHADSSQTVPMKLRLNYMSQHPVSYPLLKTDGHERHLISRMEKQVSGEIVRYIPKARVGEGRHSLGCIHDGDILAITTNKAGLDISHVGFAVWGVDGKLHLLNASSVRKKVVQEQQTLQRYMQQHPSQTGIRIVRLLSNTPRD